MVCMRRSKLLIRESVNSAPFLTKDALKVSKVVFFSARLITNSERDRKRSSSTSSLPTWLQQAELSQDETRSQDSHLGLLHGRQGLRNFSIIFHCFLRCFRRERVQKRSRQDLNSHSDKGYRCREPWLNSLYHDAHT